MSSTRVFPYINQLHNVEPGLGTVTAILATSSSKLEKKSF